MRNWINVRLLLALASINELTSRSVECLLSLPQYDSGVVLFMAFTLGIGLDENRGERVLKLNKSLYGLKQLSTNRFDPIKTGLERRGYHQYQVDPSVLYRKDSVILTCVDYSVIFS